MSALISFLLIHNVVVMVIVMVVMMMAVVAMMMTVAVMMMTMMTIQFKWFYSTCLAACTPNCT